MNERIHERADTRLRLSLAVVGAAIAVASVTTGAADPAQLDASFIAAVQADGRAVPQEADRKATLVTAARKVCARRHSQVDADVRHRSALTLRELDAVAATFAGDGRRFAALALDTYCPS